MPQPSVASSRITHSLLYLSLQLEVPPSATAICSIFKDHTQSLIFISAVRGTIQCHSLQWLIETIFKDHTQSVILLSAVRGRAVDKREYVMIIFHIFS